MLTDKELASISGYVNKLVRGVVPIYLSAEHRKRIFTRLNNETVRIVNAIKEQFGDS